MCAKLAVGVGAVTERQRQSEFLLPLDSRAELTSFITSGLIQTAFLWCYHNASKASLRNSCPTVATGDISDDYWEKREAKHELEILYGALAARILNVL